MNILITGATGLIGKAIGKRLAQKGHKILVVSRSPQKAVFELPFPCEVIEGDLSRNPIKDSRLNSVDAVINLMGEPIVGSRWNASIKKRIYDSRVVGTRNLIASLPEKLQAFIGGSAIGYYGDRGEEICDEQTSVGKDFLAQVTHDWEEASSKASGRVVLIRTGIVLSPQGGALEKMIFPFKAGLGGPLGDGQQWMSWISLEDIAGLFVFALENPKVQGVLNGTAPQPVSNLEFSKTLAKSLGRPLGLSVPKMALQLLFGEAAGTLLSSCRAAAEKATSLGYKFLNPHLENYLTDLHAPFRQGEEVFYAEQFLPETPEKVFNFFKDPHNLESITPQTLGFQIKKVSSDNIEQGTKIDYTLRIRGVPVTWKTDIDEWNPPHRFVDNQLQGPYQLWHHTHEFEPLGSGTLMTDKVRYRLPLGYVGWLVAAALVRKEIQGIFAYRRHNIRL